MRKERLFSIILLALGLGGAAPSPGVNEAALMAGEPAPSLADYRLFLDAGAARPNARVTGYGLNTPLFSDYADKRRFIYVPPGRTIRYRAEGALDFPVGAALIKHFGFVRADGHLDLIETRLLVRKPEGWAAYPYVWNADDSEAVLKKAGSRLAVTGHDGKGQPTELTWHVPNMNQCKGCHALDGEIEPIGPKARNLNGVYEGENNLARLARLGLMRGYAGKAPVLPRWDDASAALDARARAWLDVNCGHCHNPAGPASNSGLFLTWETPKGPAIGIGKPPAAAGRGSGVRLVDIDPGHPDRSILLYRIESTEPGVMMPELARTIRDEEAIELVHDWIAGMK